MVPRRLIPTDETERVRPQRRGARTNNDRATGRLPLVLRNLSATANTLGLRRPMPKPLRKARFVSRLGGRTGLRSERHGKELATASIITPAAATFFQSRYVPQAIQGTFCDPFNGFTGNRNFVGGT